WRRRAAHRGAPRLDRADQPPDRHLHLLLPDPPLDARRVPRRRLSVPDTSRRRRVSRTGKILAGVVVALVIAGAGAWWFVLRDTAAPKARVDAVAASAPAGAESRSSPDGTWTVKPSDTVFVGYRIQELFAAATV